MKQQYNDAKASLESKYSDAKTNYTKDLKDQYKNALDDLKTTYSKNLTDSLSNAKSDYERRKTSDYSTRYCF